MKLCAFAILAASTIILNDIFSILQLDPYFMFSLIEQSNRTGS